MSVEMIEATASAVTHQTLNRKSDNKPFTLYRVETDRGTFTTSRRDIAAAANSLLNKKCVFHVKSEQRGEFMNYYLEAVEAKESSFPQDMPKPRPPQPQPQPRAARPEEPVGTPAAPTDKDVFIFRQTAAKVAGQISRTPEEFWENVDAITAYFIDGTKPSAFVNAFANDDDIPF